MADFEIYIRFLLALIFVLGLIGGCAWALRRFMLERGTPRQPSRGKRLEVVETKMIDGRRKLVLLRRDHVEHLVILGANQETVIESGIALAERGRSHDRNVGQPAPEGRLVELYQGAPASKEGA